MSYQFRPHQFKAAKPVPLLVVVDPSRRHISGRCGLSDSAMARVLSRCRAVLAHARAEGMPVAFIKRGIDKTKADGGLWIKGLEPSRADALIETDSTCCYDNPYFVELAASASMPIFIGALGQGGFMNTAAAAVKVGHRAAFLYDAILDNGAEFALTEAIFRDICKMTAFEIFVVAAERWVRLTSSVPNPNENKKSDVFAA